MGRDMQGWATRGWYGLGLTSSEFPPHCPCWLRLRLAVTIVGRGVGGVGQCIGENVTVVRSRLATSTRVLIHFGHQLSSHKALLSYIILRVLYPLQKTPKSAFPMLVSSKPFPERTKCSTIQTLVNVVIQHGAKLVLVILPKTFQVRAILWEIFC